MTTVRFTTSLGVFDVALEDEKAPLTVKNFLSYVRRGFYDGLIFHRVLRNFVIQGGGYDATLQARKPGEPIPNEADNGLKNDKYTIAMARFPAPHSATCQFFINVSDNDFLNHTGPTPSGWGYAVFGHVTKGTDVVDAISKAKTARRGDLTDIPVTNVVIAKVEEI